MSESRPRHGSRPPGLIRDPSLPNVPAVKLLATAGAGTLLEYYDFFVYVSLTSTLTRLFLPHTNAAAAALAGVATFGVSYLVRPVGTLIFNPLADRVGRKKVFVITLSIMGASTVALGCLPTYAAIGTAAPILLLLLRVVQGIALGGEYGPAVVFVMEHAPARRRGYLTSYLQSTAAAGLLLSLTVVLGLNAALNDDSFDTWGWRIPFLISAPFVLIALVSRRNMHESPVFQAMQRSNTVDKRPLRTALGTRQSLKNIAFGAFGAQGGTSVTLYTSIVYMLSFLETVLKVNADTAAACVAIASALSLPFYPLAGRLSDRVGRSKVMLGGSLAWMAAAYPCFHGITTYAGEHRWVGVTALIWVLASLTGVVMAPLPAFISERFGARDRTTGFGLAQQLGNVLFGGFLPLISLSLVKSTGQHLAGVAYSVASLVPCVIVMALWGLRSEAGVSAPSGGSSAQTISSEPGKEALSAPASETSGPGFVS